MKDQNYRFEQKYCDYYVDKLCETTTKTQNDFYAECAEEIVRLRRNLERREEQLTAANQLLRDAEQEIDGLKAFQRSVNEALNSGDGSYRP